MVESIQSINSNSFVIHEKNTNNVRLLTVDYSGTDKFKDKLIFRDSSSEILKTLANKNNLYILVKNGESFCLKCFQLEVNLELTPTGLIDNIEASNPSFIDEFEQSYSINGNVLICNE